VTVNDESEYDPATAPTNHSPRATFDDTVLGDAAAFLAELDVRRLAGRPAHSATN
jgi:hippurate hydrolase